MPPDIQNCYRVLDLKEGVALQAVREAYREGMKVWHPDRFPGDPKLQRRATEKAKEINEAHARILAFLSGAGTNQQGQVNTGAWERTERRPRGGAARPEATTRPPRAQANKGTARRGWLRGERWSIVRMLPAGVLILVLTFTGLSVYAYIHHGESHPLLDFLWRDRFASGRGQLTEAPSGFDGWRAAAEKGVIAAQFNLGLSYAQGHGVPRDYVEAVRWYRKAAEGGDAAAQNNLGALLQLGQGVPKDPAMAYALYCLAATQGFEKARINRDSLAPWLTAAQRADSQRRAAVFVTCRPNVD